jgi:hypothetical protein
VPVCPTSRASALRCVLAPGFPCGTSRSFAPGNALAAASDRIVMNAVALLLFAFSVKLPT